MLTQYFIRFAAGIGVDKSQFPGLPDQPLGSNNVQNGLQLAFALAGAIALLIITIAGLQFVFSQGDPQKTVRARNTIIYAAVGLVISAMAYAIVTFVVGRL